MAAPKAKTYRANQPGYCDDAYIEEGQVFTTSKPKGSWMDEVKKKRGGDDDEEAEDAPETTDDA